MTVLLRSVLLVVLLLQPCLLHAQTARTILFEQFTGTWGGLCPYAADSIDAILNRMPNVRAVAHHIGVGEPMATWDTEWTNGHLQNQSLCPTGSIDRSALDTLPSGWVRFVFDPSDWNTELYRRAQTSSPLSINVMGSWNPISRLLDFTVVLNILQDMPGQYFLNAYLNEDSVNHAQTKYINGSPTTLNPYYHRRVTRKMISGQAGTTLTYNGFSIGQVVPQHYSYAVPASINVANCRLTVFVTSQVLLNINNQQGAFRANIQQAWQEPVMNALSVTPVELISFYGVSVAGGVHLEWRTATESNNHGWFIERRKNDGPWHDIGFVNGRGTTNVHQMYEHDDHEVEQGSTYDYRLRQEDFDGTIERSSVMRVVTALKPSMTRMLPSYPNPFNPSTHIVVELEMQSEVNIQIYDVLGRHVCTLVSGLREAGEHVFVWNATAADGTPIQAGIYFVRMSTPTFSSTQQIQLRR